MQWDFEGYLDAAEYESEWVIKLGFYQK